MKVPAKSPSVKYWRAALPAMAMLVAGCICALAPFTLSDALADQLPKPEGRVILVVDGNIEHTNDDSGEARVSFDMAMLDALEGASFETTNPWRPEMNTYEGPLLRSILEFVGAGSTKLQALAIDDYSADIDVAEYEGFPVIVASQFNGERMRIRDLGPLWIMFPLSDYPELDTNKNKARAIWQLKSMTIE